MSNLRPLKTVEQFLLLVLRTNQAEIIDKSQENLKNNHTQDISFDKSKVYSRMTEKIGRLNQNNQLEGGSVDILEIR